MTAKSAHPKVAFQGTHYAFSEIAALKYFKKSVLTLPCRSFEAVFQNIKDGTAGKGIVPVENSLTGSVYRNLDLLLEYDLPIVGETSLRIEQHLIANPGVKLEDIKVVYSHPQALEQCRNFLASLHDVDTVARYDTAGSVTEIRDHQRREAAAIASRKAAEDYGMQILREEIEDFPENYTRFFILAQAKKSISGADKTSIVFSMKNIPGALFKGLSVFALRDIDLLKIESRPLRGKPWEYIFYLDFRGNMRSKICRNAIRHLEEITTFLKVLGSYKAAPKNG